MFGQRPQLWYHLPAIDTFLLFGKIYELDEAEIHKRIAFLSEAFEIEDLLETPVRKLSLGQRMRCEVAASLLHRPRLLLLDEPSIGLDVVAKQNIRDTIRRMNELEGVGVLLTVLMVLRDHTGIDLRGVGWMGAGMLPGTALASYLLPVISLKALSLFLGALVLAGVAISLTGLHFPPRRWVLFLAGFISGLGGTLASIGGPPVALVNQDLEPKKLRATLSGYFMLSGLAALIGLVPAGRMGSLEVHLSLWLLPGVILGFFVSSLFIHKLRASMVRYVLLALSAASTVVLIGEQLIK